MTQHLKRPIRGRIPLTALATAILTLAIGATTALAVGPPIVSNTTVSAVGETSATLEATVNPNDREVDEYHFQYVDQAGFEAGGFTGAKSTPNGPPIPSGDEDIAVSASVGGLNPATTYRFRLVAHNAKGTTVGPEGAFATYAVQPSFPSCPNDAFRTDSPSAHLPNCRAYEQATPVDKNGGSVTGVMGLVKAAIGGGGITFMSDAGFPGGEGSQEMPLYLASRGEAGWSTQGLLPPPSAGQKANILGWTPDLSHVFEDATRLTDPLETTFLARPSDGGPLSTIVDYVNGLAPSIAAAPADGSQVLFESEVELVPTAIEGKPNLYLWDRDSGEISLAGVFNDGSSPPQGAFAGPYDWMRGTSPSTLSAGGATRHYYTQEQHVLSTNGSVYFTAAGTGQIYLRHNPTEPQSALDGLGKCTDPDLACTIHISATKKDNGLGDKGADAAGTQPAVFMGASADGSAAFFTSSEKLTNDATTGPEPQAPAIARATLEGEGKDIGFLLASAKGVAVDDTYIYWADPKAGTIGRATLDGETEVDPSFIEGPVKPQWVAVDSEYVYWTDAVDGQDGNGTIGRAKLDGSEVEPSFITGAHNPQGIAVNATHIYWANDGSGTGNGLTRGIARANIVNGSEVIQPWSVDVNGDPTDFPAAGVALDDTYVYFTQSTEGIVWRIKLAEPKDFKSILFTSTSDRPKGIAVNATHLYWSNNATGEIGRAELNNPEDLTEVEPNFIPAAGRPQGLAINGSHVHWSANQEIVPNNGNDLYRYDVGTGELSDLVVDDDNVDGADVQGILGASQDGSHVYFAANGDLDGGGPATPGNCAGGISPNPGGSCSVYLWHEEGGGEEIDFIARLDIDGGLNEGDAANWAATPSDQTLPNHFQKTSRVSPDGRTLLFRSREQLSDYENGGLPQLYRYRVGEGLSCVSCNPTGATPTGSATLASLRPATLQPARSYSSVTSRNLSADGNRVFFETTDALVGADVNGKEDCPSIGSENSGVPVCRDVYMWEAEGSGSCEAAFANDGCLYLLSSGKDTEPSFFADASASGDDAFIFTSDQLVGQDKDELRDVYDVRVGGGLDSQNPPPAEICEGEGCKPGTTPPPPSQSAGSASFSGPPNAKGRKAKPRCPKGKRKVRRKGKTRCIKRKGKRRANSNRRAKR
jgi:virginiamycin B lyase